MSSATSCPASSWATWPAVKTRSPAATTGEYGACGRASPCGWIAPSIELPHFPACCDRQGCDDLAGAMHDHLVVHVRRPARVVGDDGHALADLRGARARADVDEPMLLVELVDS